jgi:hypothetical protein
VEDPYLKSVLELLATIEWGEGPHLITVDELRAAGALYVPPSWRKSLRTEERDLFSDLPADEEKPKKDRPAKRKRARRDRPADA